MKQTITTILIAFSFFSCKAQTVVYNFGTPPEEMTQYNNIYMKDIDNHHDAIVGTWKWESGNSSFEITLQEFEMNNYPSTSTRFSDDVFGKYKYIENGVVIAEVNTIENYPDFKLALSFRTPTEYGVVIGDVVSDTHRVGEFVLTSPTTATLTLRISEGVKMNYGNGQEFALPTSLILTKVN